VSPPAPGAWILAGGRSRRFGADKALAELRGETLLARTARVCAEAGLGVTVVARHVRPGGLPTLLEPDDLDRHPLFGVAAALAAARAAGHTSALLLPCDLATLGVEQLSKLAGTSPPASSTDQPLFCHLPVTLAGEALAAARGGVSVRAFLRAAGGSEVDTGHIPNVNRPEDLRAIAAPPAGQYQK
jgi:molybdopterin-guanine dinucleotide biosynthesis protein A